MRIFTLLKFMLVSSLAFATTESASQREHQTEFPNDVKIYARPAGHRWEVGFLKGSVRYSLLTSDRILAMPRFADDKVQAATPWRAIEARKNGTLESASSWSYAMTDEGLHLLRFLPGMTESPWVSLQIPQMKTIGMNHFSISQAMHGKDLFIPVSFSGTDGAKGTFLIRIASTEESGKFSRYEIIEINREFHELTSGETKNFSFEGETFILGTKKHSISAAKSPGLIVKKGQQVEVIDKPVSMLQNGFSALKAIGNDMANKAIDKVVGNAANDLVDKMVGPTAAMPAAIPTAAPVSVAKEGDRRELTYKGATYVVYNSKGKDKGTDGVYVQRQNDKTIVKIAARMVNLSPEGSLQGFYIEEGLLRHSELPRHIDLEKTAEHDFFKMEASYSPSRSSQDVDWLDQEFQSFRSQVKSVPVIEARKSLIASIVQQIVKPNRASSILVGESGDKKIIQAAVIERLPRTWRVLDLDPGVLGSDLGVVGRTEEKVKQVVGATRTVPVVWMNEDTQNLKGIGAMTDGGRDFLDLIGKEFGENGSMKLVGTSYSTEDFLGRITNPQLQQNLPIKEVADLTPEQTLQYLENWLEMKPELPKLSKPFMRLLTETGEDLQPVGAEPQRSLDLMEAHLLRLEAAKKLNLAENRAELNLSAAQFYRLDPGLRDRAVQKLRLQNYREGMNATIIGHDHIKDRSFEQTQISMSGMTTDRGPDVSILLDGPPGTGKTEMAKAHAKSLGLPFVVIEMNQFKRGSGNGINELMSQVTKALKVNPFTVILFDELEKADYGVLEGLLTMMSSKFYNFYESTGGSQKRAVRGSAIRATFIGTANTVGEVVRNWFLNELTQSERENMKAQDLETEFFKKYPKTDVENKIVEKIPRPLLDRFKVRKIAFPPGEEALKGLMVMKIKELEKIALKKMRAEVTFINMKGFARETVARAFSENWSTRDYIEFVENHTKLLASELPHLDNFREGEKYLVDVETGKISRGQVIKGIIPKISTFGFGKCRSALGGH